MKERLVTLGLAFGALALFWLMFFPKPQAPGAAPPLPLSTEARASGYLAAWRWLAVEQVRVLAWHERFDRLSDSAKLPPSGNLLLVTLPSKLPIGAREAARLDAWVERGNTLLVLAALDDTPTWAALADGTQLTDQAGRLTRLKFTAQAPQDKPTGTGATLRAAVEAWRAPRTSVIEPVGSQPLLAGVRAVRTTSDLPASRWSATPMDAAAVLDLGKFSASDDAAMWLRSQGRGQVITLAFSGVFSNRDLGGADNGKLLSNIVAWTVQPGAAVIFDDAHQGAVDFYDAKAFFADARLHRTLAWLVALWFVFVLGMQRMRVHAQEWRAPDITAFIGSSGEFFAGSIPAQAVAARLFENFFNAVRRRIGLSENGVPEWDWLRSQASLPAAELTALRESHAQLQAGRRIDLLKLQNLLNKVQGKIL